ncbi:type IV pilin N-terminal domain-containing protein [Methanospirillum sp.]|uniref:type IV pilin N-terminal domain-containing protein n=1 Tax=Methanospirillum sp. TaxID=45200 RepID=UPI0035A05874
MFKKIDDAVSPVVGVLLMLIVTIIVAAIVSGFAGGLTSNEKSAPSVVIAPKLFNDGTGNTHFQIKVTSVSEPIPTKDLKIETSWVNSTGYRGGATILPNSDNLHYTSYPSNSWNNGTVPQASSGPGVGTTSAEKNFGNYSWTTGTVMTHWPPNYGFPSQLAGSVKYQYWPDWSDYISFGGDEVDAFTAILGEYWNTLRAGDTVSIKVFHLPSKKLIVNTDFSVEG